jgi:hypothetical protein
MVCRSCAERSELLMRAREAYQRGDMSEVRRLLREIFGTAIKDVDRLISAIVSKPG